MVDLEELERYARYTVDADGELVVQIKAADWERLKQSEHPEAFDLADVVRTHPNAQARALFSLIQSWDTDEDDTPNTKEWWDGFRSFLSENRLTFDPTAHSDAPMDE